MRTKRCSFLRFCLILIFVTSTSAATFAQARQPITLKVALEQVFASNPELSLFRWEQDLTIKREGLAKHPTLSLSTTPVKITDGDLQKPGGEITIKMPIAKGLDLAGGLTLNVDQSGMEATPSGSLSLTYDLLGQPETVEVGLLPEENLRQYENALVLRTLDLLVSLRQKLDEKNLAQAQYCFLEDSLEAAQLTPNYDDLKLKRELREQANNLIQLEKEIAQLELELSSLLGSSQNIAYDPSLEIVLFDLASLGESYSEEFFGASNALVKAEAALETALNRLFHERKTGGWKGEVSGKVSLDRTWNVGLSASKQLYPRQIVLEELELEVAKAEQSLLSVKKSLADQLRELLQTIESAEKRLEQQGEHLEEAQEDLKLRERQFAAGLVTELQLREAKLELEYQKISYQRAQFTWAQSVLKLWEQCGRDLPLAVVEIVR